MPKYQYLIRQAPHQSLTAFKSGMFEADLPRLQTAAVDRLKISLTETTPPRWSFLPLTPSGVALVSVWAESDPTPDEWRSDRSSATGSVAGYRVAESVPVAYDKSWADGQASPGVVILTCLKQNPGLSRDAFMHEWHERHTSKALRIHPLWNYIRNVLTEPVIPDSPAFDGMVEEHLRTRAHALNPIRFFGGPKRCIPNMIEIGRHASHFLDLKRCENYLLTEYHIRS